MFSKTTLSAAFGGLFLLSACVGTKKYDNVLDEYKVLNNKFRQMQEDLKSCENDKMRLGGNIQALESTVANQREMLTTEKAQTQFLKENTNQVMGRLQDLSVLTDKQAETVKKSLEKLSERDDYIKGLQGAMSRKDSLNLALVMNLKGALAGTIDDDIEVKVEKGVVFISISDKLLFSTGKYDINPNAKVVLGKVAQVLNNQPNIEFMVEGHTDNSPMKGSFIKDNWDLSVLRATSVVRTLQSEFGINPSRMTAGGRGEYFPARNNESAAGKAANRRTRIVILPQLDQFFQLLEPNSVSKAPGA